ncbi:DNA-directed RNA polymerase III subunit RPC10 [Bienertia sinuspersici]
MEFCPTCANLLQYEMTIPAKFFCRTCPYICPIEKQVNIIRGVVLPKKEVTPIDVGEKENVGPTTDESCPRCGHGKALYVEKQIRSADEPATIFYRCLNERCDHTWREG